MFRTIAASTIFGTLFGVGLLSSAVYANGIPNQDTPNTPTLTTKSSTPVLTAWEWPWSSPKYPFCFGVHRDDDLRYQTLYGKNLRDAQGQFLGQKQFLHSGVCKCEGRSMLDYPPTCYESDYSGTR